MFEHDLLTRIINIISECLEINALYYSLSALFLYSILDASLFWKILSGYIELFSQSCLKINISSDNFFTRDQVIWLKINGIFFCFFLGKHVHVDRKVRSSVMKVFRHKVK